MFDSQEVAVHRALGGCFALTPRVLVASTGGNRENQMTDGASRNKCSRNLETIPIVTVVL